MYNTELAFLSLLKGPSCSPSQKLLKFSVKNTVSH